MTRATTVSRGRGLIPNPILNTPFAEPTRHFEFTAEGITDTIVEGRRPSSYFIPIPQPKKGKQQLELSLEPEERHEIFLVNGLRERVSRWRQGGYLHVERRTKHLLEHWRREEREQKLFFCQLEAVETAIYLFEAAHALGDKFGENSLEKAQAAHNPLLWRLAFKMATGSGKTVVMAMLIAWQGLNKLANPDKKSFSSNFLVVTPGITIRDRLRVLEPQNPGNYYQALDLVPADLRESLGQLRIVVTNYHAFQLREKIEAPKLTKELLKKEGVPSPFTETPAEMVRRVCADLDPRHDVVVLNDEAHHCYRGKPTEEKISGEDRKEVEAREEEARIWISGLEHVHRHFGRKDASRAVATGKGKQRVRAVFDLSATPFFLRGSGYSEGTLFPWVVSDFALVDAIEAGVVKVPRVPVSDNSLKSEQPIYRELWPHIRDALPKKRAAKDAEGRDPVLPKELEGALESLYSNYEKLYRRWESTRGPHSAGTPPVFIVVCNNTAVSQLVYQYIAGYEKPGPDGSTIVAPGRFSLFSNVKDGRWIGRPNTILVDSAELESGGALSDDFKRIAAHEIADFKREYRRMHPGKDAEQITDGDLLREVMNTVGKPGKLGEGVRCVVSVSMLTEGWDTNTVTHILGVRAFTTQLLCEQVIGRGLRRMSYQVDKDGMFSPEYAEVYGVPFRFIPMGDASTPLPDDKPRTHVRSLPERSAARITFPRVVGYRFELPTDRLEARFGDEAKMVLSTRDTPTQTELSSIMGESEMHTLDHLRSRREQEIAFWLARRVVERYFRDGEDSPRILLFPHVLEIAKRWLADCVDLHDDTFKQLLLWSQLGSDAADKIYRSIVAAHEGEARVLPVYHPGGALGSTDGVDFLTARPTYLTRAEKCHVTHVVADTEAWEQKFAQSLEDMDEVLTYVKNHNIGFTIPYSIEGLERRYYPDFIVRMRHPALGEFHAVLEVTGQREQDKAAKVETAQRMWIPAVNHDGAFGRWVFLEITDPYNAKNVIRQALERLAAGKS
ncbi:DEAD/DEAH box helicase family protein [Polyangium sp. 6x1]|uniref:BPTD_3080 family restriction endonuclease n=1 Tax=Polyangium sp. 6x1 TaxID=3042689 RepID=UPI0024828C03|nr:DEAD/DEAH box helicase family protein [Polyangium sp. 6x1]MDI1442408.1 DEAD/DEAH box helicase family protein [Polyangium sp. 6x1]